MLYTVQATQLVGRSELLTPATRSLRTIISKVKYNQVLYNVANGVI